MPADGAQKVPNPPGWGSIKAVVNAPPENVTTDGSWISVIGMWLWLLPTLLQGIVGGLVAKVFVCFSIGDCCPCSRNLCSSMGYILSGRPLLKVWTMWRATVATLVALIANKRSRLALFIWEWEAFGKGRYWWHGEGVWEGGYEDCNNILLGPQNRKQALGCNLAPVPDLFPSRLLIFLPNPAGQEASGSEWKAIRMALHQFFLDQGTNSYKTRMARLPGLLAGDWGSPKLTDLSDLKVVQRYVSKCIFFMLFEVWVTHDEAAILSQWRTEASTFVLPRGVQRLMFNIKLNKIKKLREETVGLVEKYGKQELFVQVNNSLGPWKRDEPVKLCDDLMFAMGFAGIGGTCAATESTGAFLQVKLPEESPGEKYIHFGQYDTSDKMVAKFLATPDKFIKETCRLDPPVTSATTSLAAPMEATLADRKCSLPEGLLNQYALSLANRNEGLFPDPSTFKPDRDNLDKALTWNGPFGAPNEASYPRICPGRYMSLDVTRTVVMHVLRPSDSPEIAGDPASIAGASEKAPLLCGCA